MASNVSTKAPMRAQPPEKSGTDGLLPSSEKAAGGHARPPVKTTNARADFPLLTLVPRRVECRFAKRNEFTRGAAAYKFASVTGVAREAQASIILALRKNPLSPSGRGSALAQGYGGVSL
jgi:hypothetical protein